MTLRETWGAFALALLACIPVGARAEGSRDLYPSAATGTNIARGNLEWRTSSYGGGLLKRRTLLHVYAQQNEYILLGSSAVGVAGTSTGNALVYGPSNPVTGPIGGETIPATPDFQATSQSGRGKITTRTQELAGAQAISGGGNPNGYAPAYYQAPETGLYSIVFYGPNGGNDDTNGTVAGDIGLTAASDTNSTQYTSVAAWDVTVRSSDQTSTSDLTGRLFTNYLALFNGGNGRSLYGKFFAVTTDGYQYQVDLNGVDPNGFIIYGNQLGFLDSDGQSPLYHDVVSTLSATNRDQLTQIQGGCSLSPPTYPLFFNAPDPAALMADGVATAPTTPVISALSFSGTVSGNNSRIGTGGTFSYTGNVSAVYDIVISRDGSSFDPTLPGNRRLRGRGGAGTNTVTWDGKDNSGASFPVGTGYSFHALIHGGEYHFPLLDAENSFFGGGPSITMLNAANPLGASQGFYDDRGYRTVGGSYVTSDGTAATLGQAVGTSGNPPNPTFSDPLAGYDTTSAQRKYGDASSSTGFGDKKGLDLWTYYPSNTSSSTLNIQGPPTVLLVKRITAVNGTNTTGFDDDPGTTDDNSTYWPAPASTYLRGVRSVANVKPGDELEYTIYFLDTNGPGTNITLADVLPADTTFETTAYDGLTPTDGGTPGADSGIALALSASSLPTAPTNYLSNAADSDRGQFYAPGTSAPAAANPGAGFASPLPAASNLSGVVAVTLAPAPATLPSATGAGTPTGSYGFLRFRVRVK